MQPRPFWSSQMQHLSAHWDNEHERSHELASPYLHGNLIHRALEQQQQQWLHADEARADENQHRQLPAKCFANQSPEERLEERIAAEDRDPSLPF